jgi:hypothetical protein
MTAREGSVFLIYVYHALFRTSVAASLRAWMVTATKRSRARLQAKDSVVEKIRMAFLSTGMSTTQPVDTAQVATSFGRELWEIFWRRDRNRCIWMARALKLQGRSDILVLLQNLYHLSPHGNMDRGLRIADDVHAVLCP